MLQALTWAAAGTGFTALMTASGAAVVFLFRKKNSKTLHRVMLGSLPSGLRPTELKWEETGWDEDTSMFLRRGSLSCSAFFTALAEEDGALISDFILKGVVTKG